MPNDDFQFRKAKSPGMQIARAFNDSMRYQELALAQRVADRSKPGVLGLQRIVMNLAVMMSFRENWVTAHAAGCLQEPVANCLVATCP